MLHNPCGLLNPNAKCMENGKCTKQFPKDFSEVTVNNGVGYPVYRRRDNGVTFPVKVYNQHGKDKNNFNIIELDNRWIVPYNLYLTTKYDCHINVEICSSVQAVKYLYKYVYKGPDRAQAQFQPINTDQNIVDVDEISEYCDARYVSAIEAVWHIFHFTMHFQTPPVLRLDLHLENHDTILFSDSDKVEDIKNKQKLSKFTAWFKLNQEDLDARQHLYHDIPKYYVWKSTERVWQKRKKFSETKMIVS